MFKFKTMHFSPFVINRNSFFIGIFFILSSVFAQDKPYALSCVKTLSAPNFHGRGFVNNGDKKAAKFIETEFKKWGTKAFNNSYQQKFTLDINTISKGKVSIDHKALVLGKDYLVFAASSTAKGDYKLYYPDNFSVIEFTKQDHKNEIFVLDTIHNKSKELIDNYRKIIGNGAFNNSRGIIEVSGRKLTQTQRTYELGFPFIQIKEESWDSTAQTIQLDIKHKLKKQYQTQNIIGYIEGEIDSFYVFTGHYDHLGRVGQDVYFPGANDNASGVSTILSLAKYYHDSKTKPKYNIAFMLFSAEEAGLIGSLYYTKNPLFPLEKIKFLFNLDMVGTGTEGLSVVNGKENKKASDLLIKTNEEHNYFKDIRIGKGSANSDHHFFDASGVPAVFLFTRGGPQFYHDIYDRHETLEMNKLEELIKLLTQFVNQY